MSDLSIANLPSAPVMPLNAADVIPVSQGGTTYKIPAGSAGIPGPTVQETITQTNTFSVGQVIYYNGSSYVLAQANAAATAEVTGVVSAASGAQFTVVYSGRINGLSGLTPGQAYFLSDVTAGLMQTTAPTTPGYVSKPVLDATSTTSGIVLPYRGAIITSAPATPIVSVKTQTFAASGTYTPSAGMAYCDVEVVAGGGGGGGAGYTASNSAAAGGGGGGGYAKGRLTAAQVGTSQTVTVGAAGAGGAAGANNGTAGGNTSFGGLVTATGGSPGVAGTPQSTVGFTGTGGAAGVGTAGDILGSGEPGSTGFIPAAGFSIQGKGGNSIWGGGGIVKNNNNAGTAGTGLGAGGSGASNVSTGGATAAGGNGTIGFVRVTEFCTQ